VANKQIEKIVDDLLAQFRVRLIANLEGLAALAQQQAQGTLLGAENVTGIDRLVLMSFPVVGTGVKRWALTVAQLVEWEQLYPNLDVKAECRKASAWLEANPSRRKTAKGMPACLVNWLNRATNSGRAAAPAARPVARASGEPRRQYFSSVPDDVRALCDRAGLNTHTVEENFKECRLEGKRLYIPDPGTAGMVARHWAAKMGVTVVVGS